jgi:hypothetical protein
MMATAICNFPGIIVKATGEMVEWASIGFSYSRMIVGPFFPLSNEWVISEREN